MQIFLRRFGETKLDLEASEYFQNTSKKVLPLLGAANLERIVCLGLGRITGCPISRHQLAFIRCLQDKLGFAGAIEYFDPVFCERTVDILEKLGGVVLRTNCEDQ